MIATEHTTAPTIESRSVLATTRAVAMVLDHGTTHGLPLPTNIGIEAGDVPHLWFDDLTDLYAWATYIDEPVAADWIDQAAGIRRHHCTGEALDLRIRLMLVQLEGGDPA